MVKWHAYGRCKTRLSKDIGKFNAAKVQSMMTKHTLSVAKSLEEKGLIDICLAISGLGLKNSKKWSRQLGVQNYSLQGKGCLGEKMKRQILINKKFCIHNKIKNIIFIGTDLPDLCHLDILNTTRELEQNDLILGPSNDGGYWLIALSEKILSNYPHQAFININWSSQNVLRMTVNQLNQQNLKIDYLDTKIDIDTINDIDQRR